LRENRRRRKKTKGHGIRRGSGTKRHQKKQGGKGTSAYGRGGRGKKKMLRKAAYAEAEKKKRFF